jgi:hypothetical protein
VVRRSSSRGFFGATRLSRAAQKRSGPISPHSNGVDEDALRPARQQAVEVGLGDLHGANITKINQPSINAADTSAKRKYRLSRVIGLSAKGYDPDPADSKSDRHLVPESNAAKRELGYQPLNPCG